jgi:hypothetical protein
MAMTSTQTQVLQEEILSAIRKGQETALDAIKTCIQTVQSVTPKLPTVRVPLTEHLPKPEDVVASAYDFAEVLLVGQRKFTEDVIKATASLLPGDAKSAPEDSAK